MSAYPEGKCPICPECNRNHIRQRGSRRCQQCARSAYWWRATTSLTAESSSTTEPAILDTEALLKFLKKGPATVADVATALKTTPGQALDAILDLRAAHLNLHEIDGKWSLEKVVPPSGDVTTFETDPDGTFTFGICSDNHLGSKYARLDVLKGLYDWFEDEHARVVFNAGNWIDGEDEKNKWDLEVHGLEPQVDYLVEQFPSGLPTYAVWGEDHEGWFARRESIDVGRFTESKMRQAGREDWHDLGFMEAQVELVHPSRGSRSKIMIMHPGGGSAYAMSYKPQKIVESLTGGEKPAMLLIGHYHKLSCNLIRNVWAIQVGCTEDQTPFMRKLQIEPHVGGAIIKVWQDDQGALVQCQYTPRQYFNRAYYNRRWNKTGAVVKSDRSVINQ